jgi:hypothetical protein
VYGVLDRRSGVSLPLLRGRWQLQLAMQY